MEASRPPQPNQPRSPEQKLPTPTGLNKLAMSEWRQRIHTAAYMILTTEFIKNSVDSFSSGNKLVGVFWGFAAVSGGDILAEKAVTFAKNKFQRK